MGMILGEVPDHEHARQFVGERDQFLRLFDVDIGVVHERMPADARPTIDKALAIIRKAVTVPA